MSSLVVALACGILVCGAAAAASRAGVAEEARVASMVEQWFASLEAQPSEGWAVETFLAESPLAFSLTEAGDLGPDELAGWLFALRSSHPKVEYRLDKVRLDSPEEDLVRVRFEFDRHAIDAAGLPHLARREQTWLIRDLPGEVPVVLRIEEQRLLAFPGTGPQIVCY
ncbi:MAG: hypothetical protein JRG90_12460 [Deltaproteobacteria bacterium]|nr:hypothetical protein [Deltaproteobacteria bacterium]